jgi:NADH-quinone oxidoreductase subunit F
LLRQNPYQVLEGLAIAATALSAERAFIGIKSTYRTEIRHLESAAAEMADGGLLGKVVIEIIEGPDDYLLGEEKALLEVIEGQDPLPRLNPPYIQGLFSAGGEHHPTVVNNVETLANVPHILREGSDWFRSFGTDRSPGTMLFTVSGDVRREAVVELPLGTPLSSLVYDRGEGLESGRRVKAIWSGASNGPIAGRDLDVPLDYESLQAVGSGLGSGGFIVSDDTACVVGMAEVLSRFLWNGSCGQCPPCKLGTEAITERLARLESGRGTDQLIREIAAWSRRVTDANRCGLGAAQQSLAVGLLNRFLDDLTAHVGAGCPHDQRVWSPVIVDYAAEAGRFVYARTSDRR